MRKVKGKMQLSLVLLCIFSARLHKLKDYFKMQFFGSFLTIVLNLFYLIRHQQAIQSTVITHDFLRRHY